MSGLQLLMAMSSARTIRLVSMWESIAQPIWDSIELGARSKQNPLRRAHLHEFVASYSVANRAARKPNWSEANPKGRWRAYGYDELAARDKCNLDVTWLSKDGEGDDGPGTDPAGIARAIIDDVPSALAGFAELEGWDWHRYGARPEHAPQGSDHPDKPAIRRSRWPSYQAVAADRCAG